MSELVCERTGFAHGLGKCCWNLQGGFPCPGSGVPPPMSSLSGHTCPADGMCPGCSPSCTCQLLCCHIVLFLLPRGFFAYKNLRLALTKIQLDRNTCKTKQKYGKPYKLLCLLHIMFQNIKDSTGTRVHSTHSGVLGFRFFFRGLFYLFLLEVTLKLTKMNY